MNIAFFLMPKQETVYLTEHSTLRQALERMEFHRYTAVPILNEEGKYVGTITEGDLLWYLKNNKEVTFNNAHHYLLNDVPLRVQNQPVQIDAKMDDLLSKAKTQNFVPVIDDMNNFIGLVRRSDIIEYCIRQMFDSNQQSSAKK